MGIDSRIPMMGQPIDTATPIDSAQNSEMNALKIIKQHYDNADDVQKKQVQEAAIGATHLEALKDNPELIQKYLADHSNMFGESAQELQDTWAQDQTPDKKSFHALVNSYKQVGLLTGAIKDPKIGSQTFGSEVVANLMKEKNMTYEQALFQYQSGNRQGVSLDGSGTMVPMNGALDTKTSGKQAEKIGEQRGEGIGKAQVALGSAENNADYVLQNVEELMTHPGKKKALGLVDSNTPTVKGSDADAFEQRLSQIGGAAFLTAFDALRGAGAITEAEGSKATVAKNRMLVAHTEAEFDDAAKEFVGEVRKGIRLARQQAAGKLSDPSKPPSLSGLPPVFNDPQNVAPAASGGNGWSYVGVKQ